MKTWTLIIIASIHLVTTTPILANSPMDAINSVFSYVDFPDNTHRELSTQTWLKIRDAFSEALQQKIDQYLKLLEPLRRADKTTKKSPASSEAMLQSRFDPITNRTNKPDKIKIDMLEQTQKNATAQVKDYISGKLAQTIIVSLGRDKQWEITGALFKGFDPRNRKETKTLDQQLSWLTRDLKETFR